MTDAQQREAARQFFYRWNGKGREDEDARSYWIEILQDILGVDNVTKRVDFEKKVIGADGNTKRIDVYIPETHVLIEQKSLGIALDKHQVGHNGQTPFEQAKYYDDALLFNEKARWIVTSNFSEIWIYDMNKSAKEREPLRLTLNELPSKYHLLDFLVNKEVKKVSDEMQISLQAGDIVGALYDAFHKQYKNPDDPETLRSLNKLCVRIVFCLYAEDADVFGKKGLFHDYMEQFDVKSARKGLRDLFRVLNQKVEDRDSYLADDDPMLASFPYVNGGLFDGDDIEIPPFTDEIMDLLLRKASADFDWSDISPTIFGAVFESTLNPETRRSGGMHYTSIENIHKVIDPLFLDDLQKELEEIKAIDVVKIRDKKLREFHDKLASLKFLDPAAGSGNFLTESYLQIRKLENEVIKLLQGGSGQIAFAEVSNPIKVSIGQFYGIEINDFAVTVARTALWIAENQMLKATEDIVHSSFDFLPLKTAAHIAEGNALRMDWNDVIPASELDYIMGNPPFVGLSLRSSEQQADMATVFEGNDRAGRLDYVAAWYKKTAVYTENTHVQSAFVSTNSICQGEQAPILWDDILNHHKMFINFAHRTFIWNSEAKDKAAVHCVIIGFSHDELHDKKLFSHGDFKFVQKINGYLVDADNVFISLRGKAPANRPRLVQDNKPWDGGYLILSTDERNELICKYPAAEPLVRPYIGSFEFINNRIRYCLWLKDVSPAKYSNIPPIIERLDGVAETRKKTKTVAVQAQAETPMLFSQIRQPESDYILIPETSSSKGRYIPIGYMDSNVIASNSTLVATDADLYIFGLLTSNVHMSWVRTICGRLKSDYRYSPSVYNNFPWPEPTEAQRAAIEQTAQGIFNARALYPDSSLAELYDPLTMPPELLKAHKANDIAVMKAYGLPIKETDEASCVAFLMKRYQELTVEEKGNK